MDLRRSAAPPHVVQNETAGKPFTLDKEVLLSRKIEIVYGYLPSGLLATAIVSGAIALFLAGHPAYGLTGVMLLVYLFSLMLISFKTGRWIENYLITSDNGTTFTIYIPQSCEEKGSRFEPAPRPAVVQKGESK